ncbi:MAG: TIGR04282 family arsenosugar biosynthesis glycosyltransferase [Syntrophomonadaceae bacterium]|nr:TIGR04282 family arsenosugar biosynthesis glycosyltransferase [Syntrophomonadaceae bacterium]
MDIAIVVMSKVPLPGYTKTRLIPWLTPEECADFQRSCLRDLTQTVITTGWPAYLYYLAPDRKEDRLSDWPDNKWWGFDADIYAHIAMRTQQGRDLGERMDQAAREVLGEREAVLFLGSDLPYLSARILAEALANLESNDVVLGPAEDGGYYLLGIKQAYAFLFDDMLWGSSEVLANTLDRIKKNGLSYKLLMTGRDIDTWEDLQDYCRRGQSHPDLQKLESCRIAQEVMEKYRQR